MKFRTLLLGLSALFVGFNAAFFSVTGLAKLFAGASVSVMIMASSLELAKLITAGYLYNYWDKINKGFRIYLSIGVVILILITSLGIYGFLTAAFQDTLNQYNVSSKQKAFLQQKESYWGSDVARFDKELERISNNISTLSNAKSTGIQVRDTTSSTGFRQTISTTELRLSQKRIEVEEQNRREVQSKREVAADSLQSIQLKILELDTDTETGSELGPLQYLSTLLDKPMTDIINWFILIIIFVFDPLAVSLIIAFNLAVKVDKGEVDKKKVVQKRELYGENDDSGSLSEESNLWDTTLNDGLDDLEWDDEEDEPNEALKEATTTYKETINEHDTILNGLDAIDDDFDVSEVSDLLDSLNISEEDVVDDRNLDIDGDGIITDEERAADLDGDGEISEEEKRIYYENGGWKNPYNGQSYYHHPWFDWKKTERWVNDRRAIDYWLKYRGGSANSLEKIKVNKYPEDFNSKTY
jgi:hypothetical protein